MSIGSIYKRENNREHHRGIIVRQLLKTFNMLLISLFVTIYIIFHTNWVGPKPLLQQPRGNCRTVDFKTNQCTSNKTVEQPQPKPNPKEKIQIQVESKKEYLLQIPGKMIFIHHGSLLLFQLGIWLSNYLCTNELLGAFDSYSPCHILCLHLLKVKSSSE